MVSPAARGCLPNEPSLSRVWSWQAIAHAMKPCSLSHKELLFARGELGDCMYFLEHGSVKMQCPTNQVRKYTFLSGSFFGVEQVVRARLGYTGSP